MQAQVVLEMGVSEFGVSVVSAATRQVGNKMPKKRPSAGLDNRNMGQNHCFLAENGLLATCFLSEANEMLRGFDLYVEQGPRPLRTAALTLGGLAEAQSCQFWAENSLKSRFLRGNATFFKKKLFKVLHTLHTFNLDIKLVETPLTTDRITLTARVWGRNPQKVEISAVWAEKAHFWLVLSQKMELDLHKGRFFHVSPAADGW